VTAGLDFLNRALGRTPAERPVPEPERTEPPAEDSALPERRSAGTIARRGGVEAAIRVIFTEGRARWKRVVERDGGVVNHCLHSKQPSVAEHGEYARSKPWVRPGDEGGPLDRAGTRYHTYCAPWLVALGNLIIGLSKYGLRAHLAGFFATVLTWIFTCSVIFHGHWVLTGLTFAGLWALHLTMLFAPAPGRGKDKSC
jgi:hypothetical protein